MISRLDQMHGFVGRLRQISWTPLYVRELEADFLAIYRIEDPWSLPGPKFFRLALRTPYYQGAMQAKIMAEQDRLEKSQNGGEVRYEEAPQLNSQGMDMRHNAAAAKAAAKGLKGENADEVKVVPLSSWLAVAPPGTAVLAEGTK